MTVYRYDGPEVNTSLAHSEAKILHGKIHDKAYSDDEIIRILTTRSKAQLLATFNSYNDQFGHPITKVIIALITVFFPLKNILLTIPCPITKLNDNMHWIEMFHSVTCHCLH